MKSNSKKVTEEKHEKKQFILNDKKLKKIGNLGNIFLIIF